MAVTPETPSSPVESNYIYRDHKRQISSFDVSVSAFIVRGYTFGTESIKIQVVLDANTNLTYSLHLNLQTLKLLFTELPEWAKPPSWRTYISKIMNALHIEPSFTRDAPNRMMLKTAAVIEGGHPSLPSELHATLRVKTAKKKRGRVAKPKAKNAEFTDRDLYYIVSIQQFWKMRRVLRLGASTGIVRKIVMKVSHFSSFI